MQANILMSHLVPLFREIMLAGYEYRFDLIHPSINAEGVMVYRAGDHEVAQFTLALNKVWVNAPDFGFTARSSDNPYFVIEELIRRFEWMKEPNRPPLRYHESRPVIALFHTRDIGVIRLDTPKYSQGEKQ